MVLLAELEQDGTPVLKKIAKVVLKQRYDVDESAENSQKALVISKWAIAASVAVPLFIEFWRPVWAWINSTFSCHAM